MIVWVVLSIFFAAFFVYGIILEWNDFRNFWAWVQTILLSLAGIIVALVVTLVFSAAIPSSYVATESEPVALTELQENIYLIIDNEHVTIYDEDYSVLKLDTDNVKITYNSNKPFEITTSTYESTSSMRDLFLFKNIQPDTYVINIPDATKILILN